MSAGEAVVWCVGLICGTIVICISVVAVVSAKETKKESIDKP